MSQPSYTILRNRLIPSSRAALFKWVLVVTGVALILWGVKLALQGVSALGWFSTMVVLALPFLEKARDLETLLKSSDPDLPRQVHSYQQLRGRPWAPTASQIQAKLPTAFESDEMMANPLTWKRKQRVLDIFDGALKITMYERNGVVGNIKLEIWEPPGPESQQALQRLENISMGIDLDILIEIRRGEQWQWRAGPVFKRDQQLEEDFFIPRNRTFFDLFERRSLPDDLSDALRTGIRKTWGDPPEATYTWLTFHELLAMGRWVPPDVRYIYDPLVEYVHDVGKPPEDVRLILQFS